MRVLVTGGAGFIGSHFIDMLVSDTSIQNEVSSITVVDKLTYAGNIKNLSHPLDSRDIEFFEGDICDYDFLKKISKGHDWIVNFAAESHVDRSLVKTEEFVNSNVLGVVNLLNIALENNIGGFLQVSTDEVYGSIVSGSWDENTMLNPRSPYSASKASADLFCNAFNVSHKLDTRVTRSSNNFGPRQNLEKFIPTVINKLLKSEAIPVYGNGSNIRDWIYVNDHCRGIWQVLKFGSPGEIYNLGGDCELTNLDLINVIAKLLDIREPKIDFIKDRKGHDFRYSLNSDKAFQKVGFTSSNEFQLNLQATINYYKNII